MNNGEKVLLIIISVIILSVIVFLIIDYRNKKIVLKNSERIQILIKYNRMIRYTKLEHSYLNHQECKSKRQLDTFSINDYFMDLIDFNEKFFRSVVDALESNICRYNDYITNVNQIKSTITEDFCKRIGLKYATFIKYEDRIFEKNKLPNPQMDVIIYCKASYTSPTGKNYYWKAESYRLNDIKRGLELVITRREQKQRRQNQIKEERSKLTPSLRYDILRRDNFMCQICGSTAKDGVQLHVDHIVPVSKGGKTEKSNLRTLCDRCNLGKSDKIE